MTKFSCLFYLLIGFQVILGAQNSNVFDYWNFIDNPSNSLYKEVLEDAMVHIH